jgi:hypothetical protein
VRFECLTDFVRSQRASAQLPLLTVGFDGLVVKTLK